jgi:hypothetical protein
MAETVNKEFLYRKLEQTRRLVKSTKDAVAIEGLKTHIGYIERQLAGIEAREADAPPDDKGAPMADARDELKQQLSETTERWKIAQDPEAKDLLGADVRELERLIEIAAEQDPDLPREPPRDLTPIAKD